MTSLLLIKDLQLLLKDFKFQLFFVLLIALFMVSAVSSSVAYRANTQEFQEALNEHLDKVYDDSAFRLREMITTGRHITVIDVPSPALLFSSYENYYTKLSNDVMFYNPVFTRYGSAGSEAFRLNWNFIIGILSGLFMLILSFEAISKEKLSGTLRLLSINGFKRQSILWCKYISYMTLYIIIIVPPALISMLLFFAFTGTWEVSYMLKFLLMIFLSIPFASFFVMLGIFISMAKNYRTSIVLVISIWLLFVIIIPQAANIFGKQLAPIKTTTEYKQNQTNIYKTEFTGRIQIEQEEAQKNEIQGWNVALAGPYNYADEKRNLAEQEELYENKRQLKTIESIANFSPFTQYEKLSEIIFDKGLYLQGFQELNMKNTISQVRNLIIEQDSRDETSEHIFFSNVANVHIVTRDRDSGTSEETIIFSHQKFEHPNLLFVTNTPTDDPLQKTKKVMLWLLPILLANLLLIAGSVLKLEKLDIR